MPAPDKKSLFKAEQQTKLASLVERAMELQYIESASFRYSDQFGHISAGTEMGVVSANIFLGSLAAIYDGVCLLAKEDDYKKTQNQIKGGVLIASGVLSFMFNKNFFTQVATAGNAASTGLSSVVPPLVVLTSAISLFIASIDYWTALQKLTLKGWFEETEKEIDYLEKQKVKTDKTNEKINNLKRDVTIRYAANADSIEKMPPKERDHIQKIAGKFSVTINTNEIESRENAIQKNLQRDTKNLRADVFVKTLLFTASICGAVAFFAFPPLGFAVLGIIGLVATYYLAVHGKKLYDHTKERFFAKSKTTAANDITKKQSEDTDNKGYTPKTA